MKARSIEIGVQKKSEGAKNLADASAVIIGLR